MVIILNRDQLLQPRVRISCDENTHVANVNDAYCSSCGSGYQKGSHDVVQGHTSECIPVALDQPTISGGTSIIYGSNDIH